MLIFLSWMSVSNSENSWIGHACPSVWAKQGLCRLGVPGFVLDSLLQCMQSRYITTVDSLPHTATPQHRVMQHSLWGLGYHSCCRTREKAIKIPHYISHPYEGLLYAPEAVCCWLSSGCSSDSGMGRVWTEPVYKLISTHLLSTAFALYTGCQDYIICF